jgi:hypothetical protein
MGTSAGNAVRAPRVGIPRLELPPRNRRATARKSEVHAQIVYRMMIYGLVNMVDTRVIGAKMRHDRYR